MDNQPAAPITTGRPWFRLASLARMEALGQLPPAPAASATPTSVPVPAPPIPRPAQVPAQRISESLLPPPPPPPPVAAAAPIQAQAQAQAQPSPPPPPSPRIPPQPAPPIQAQAQPSPPPPSPRVPQQVQPSTPHNNITNGAPLGAESQQAPTPQAMISLPLPAPPPPQSPIRRAFSRSPTPPESPKKTVSTPPPSRTPPESPRIRQLPPIKAPPPSDSPRIRQLQPIKAPPSPVAHPEPEPNSHTTTSNLKNYTNMRGTHSPPKRDTEAHKGTGMTHAEWKKNKKVEDEAAEMKMITMAGDNMGAYMELGTQLSQHVNHRQLHGHRHHKAEESHSEDGRSKKEKGKTKTQGKPIEAVVNSNVQSVNNSIVLSSSCTQHSPGVHMAILRGKQEPKHKGEAHH